MHSLTHWNLCFFTTCFFFSFLSILFCIVLLSYKTVSWLTTLNKVLLFVLLKIENNQSEDILLYFQHFFYPRVSQTFVSKFSVMNDAFWRIRAGERKMAVLFSSTGPQDMQLKGVRCRSQSTWPLVVLCCRQKRWSRSFLEVFPYFKQVYIMKWTIIFLHKINKCVLYRLVLKCILGYWGNHDKVRMFFK